MILEIYLVLLLVLSIFALCILKLTICYAQLRLLFLLNKLAPFTLRNVIFGNIYYLGVYFVSE